MKRLFAFLTAALMLGCEAQALTLDSETGKYVDENGQAVTDYWDEEAGIYVDAEGNAHDIVNVDDEEASVGTQNEDGSIEVNSGEGGTGTTEDESTGGLTQEEWEARLAKAVRTNGSSPTLIYTDENGVQQTAELVYLGLGRSKIRLQSGEKLVDTSCLSWETKADAAHVLAVVNANKQGYARLRAKSSSKAFVMDTITTTRVVQVLSYGKNWTKVSYDGMCGYVQTACLTFYDNSPKSYTTGCISYKGRTKGKSTINIRAKAKNGSRILADYVLGTPLTIFATDEKWCEIDVEGWHCYILAEYVTQDEAASMTAQVR